MNIKYIEIYNKILESLEEIKLKKNTSGFIYKIRFLSKNSIIKCSMYNDRSYYVTFQYYEENGYGSYYLRSRMAFVSLPEDFDEYDFENDHAGIEIEDIKNLVFKLNLEKELDKSENLCIVEECLPKRRKI